MIDSELRREIKTEIERQVQIILAGISGNNTNSIETIENLYPGMPNVVDRPVMHPYGMVSRAKKGTVQVVARQGEHLGNWVVMGHRDKDRPDVEEGETILYNTDSKAFIYLRKDGFEIECEGVKLLEQLIKLMNTIINARTNTIFGPQPLIPNPAGVVLGETFLQIKQQLTTLKGVPDADESKRLGSAVADALQTWASANVPQDQFITGAQLEEAWKVITGQHKTHLNDNADIELDTADIDILPGTFEDSANQPITGLGENSAVTLTQKIK